MDVSALLKIGGVYSSALLQFVSAYAELEAARHFLEQAAVHDLVSSIEAARSLFINHCNRISRIC